MRTWWEKIDRLLFRVPARIIALCTRISSDGIRLGNINGAGNQVVSRFLHFLSGQWLSVVGLSDVPVQPGSNREAGIMLGSHA